MSVANSEMRGCSKRQISTAPGRAAVEQFWVCAPQLRSGQVISILRPHGFQWVGQSGSHQKWRNPTTAKQVIVPIIVVVFFPLAP